MWGDNTNGLSSTGLLRPTDSSSAIRRNYNYYYYYYYYINPTAFYILDYINPNAFYGLWTSVCFEQNG